MLLEGRALAARRKWLESSDGWLTFFWRETPTNVVFLLVFQTTLVQGALQNKRTHMLTYNSELHNMCLDHGVQGLQNRNQLVGAGEAATGLGFFHHRSGGGSLSKWLARSL